MQCLDLGVWLIYPALLDPIGQLFHVWVLTSFLQARSEVYNQRLISSGDDDVYQLEVDLTSLHFTHHPLFSVEHVIASRLQQACQQYASKMANKSTDYHNERVSTFRECEIVLLIYMKCHLNRSKPWRRPSMNWSKLFRTWYVLQSFSVAPS